MSKRRTQWHPLQALFYAGQIGTEQGMNWLQDRGLIADEAIEIEDVAACDVKRVLELAVVKFNPVWLKQLWEGYEKKMLTDASACNTVLPP